jgi:hypothetical protein
MKPAILKTMVLLVISLFSLRCGTETILLIVAFSANWQFEDDPAHTIEFRQDSENNCMSEGIFTGREFHETNDDLDDNLLAGSFRGDEIEFIIQRRGIGEEAKFEGYMETTGQTDCHTATRLILNNGSTVIVPL